MPLLRGVRDCKIRKWSAVGSYSGSTLDLIGVNQFEVNDRVNEDTAEGDDAEIDYFSEAVGAEVRARFFEQTEVGMDVIAMITNQTVSSDASGHERLSQGTGRYAYLGLAAQVYDVDGVSDRHFFVRKGKVTGMRYTPSYNGYLIQDLQFRAVKEDPTSSSSAPYDLIEHDTAIAIAIPPTWTP